MPCARLQGREASVSVSLQSRHFSALRLAPGFCSLQVTAPASVSPKAPEVRQWAGFGVRGGLRGVGGLPEPPCCSSAGRLPLLGGHWARRRFPACTRGVTDLGCLCPLDVFLHSRSRESGPEPRVFTEEAEAQVRGGAAGQRPLDSSLPANAPSLSKHPRPVPPSVPSLRPRDFMPAIP